MMKLNTKFNFIFGLEREMTKNEIGVENFQSRIVQIVSENKKKNINETKRNADFDNKNKKGKLN